MVKPAMVEAGNVAEGCAGMLSRAVMCFTHVSWEFRKILYYGFEKMIKLPFK